MKRILSIQDISCVGQCSLTVALPIISACGIEASILPTAILSTHTGGFKNFTFLDLTSELEKIKRHWLDEKITFDGIYTGYMGSKEQIDIVKGIIKDFKKPGDIILVDPAMADNKKLYYGFDKAFVKEMKSLVEVSDYTCPNLTEASFILDKECKDVYTKEDVESILKELSSLGPKKVILTGVSFEDDKLGVAMYDKDLNKIDYYFTEKIDKSFHGTGDIWASAFYGSLIKGKSMYDACKLACDFTVQAIKYTYDDDAHWYGVHFEEALDMLTK